MNKKVYITPEMEVIEMEVVDMLSASIGISEEEKDAGEAYSNRRRGKWGNLWAEDE